MLKKERSTKSEEDKQPTDEMAQLLVKKGLIKFHKAFNPGINESRKIPLSPGAGGGSKKKLEGSVHLLQKGATLRPINKDLSKLRECSTFALNIPDPLKKLQMTANPSISTDDSCVQEITPRSGWQFDVTKVRRQINEFGN